MCIYCLYTKHAYIIFKISSLNPECYIANIFARKKRSIFLLYNSHKISFSSEITKIVILIVATGLIKLVLPGIRSSE